LIARALLLIVLLAAFGVTSPAAAQDCGPAQSATTGGYAGGAYYSGTCVQTCPPGQQALEGYTLPSGRYVGGGCVGVISPPLAAPPTGPDTSTSGDGSATVAGPAQPTASTDTTLSNDNYYTNVDGVRVHSPAYSLDGSVPACASATCADGTYSFSLHRQGTCSSHGGVSQWTSTAPQYTSSAGTTVGTSGGGTVSVSGYTRSDGTYVPRTLVALRAVVHLAAVARGGAKHGGAGSLFPPLPAHALHDLPAAQATLTALHRRPLPTAASSQRGRPLSSWCRRQAPHTTHAPPQGHG
jgi:hypothetical protein